MTAPWGELVVAALLLASGFGVLTAAVGLLRLPDFFARLHAPSLAATLSAWLVALASTLHFWAGGGSGLSLRVAAAVVLLAITAPVTTMLLSRAALFRRRQAGDALPSPLRGAAEDAATASAPDSSDPGGPARP